MKTLIFKNGELINFIECYGRKEYVQGIQRDVLDFRFNPNAITLNEVDKLFSIEECEKLTIYDQNNEFIHNDYSVRVSIGKQKFTLMNELGEAEEVEQISVKMAKLTHIEKQLAILGIKI